MDMKACDKMILAIIQDDSYQDVISELNESGFYATILHSSGGFLKKQSVTIMIGLNHEDLEKALKILKSHGKRTVMQQQVLSPGERRSLWRRRFRSLFVAAVSCCLSWM